MLFRCLCWVWFCKVLAQLGFSVHTFFKLSVNDVLSLQICSLVLFIMHISDRFVLFFFFFFENLVCIIIYV
jgi:hypothetical protein